jgi:hypothetical protein
VQPTQETRPQPVERPAFPVPDRPKPSSRRTHEQRVVRNHERLVAAWLRSLSAR